MRAAMSHAQHVGAPPRGPVAATRRRRLRSRSAVIALSVATCFGAAADADAFTLTLAFPDGQPMTDGSARARLGCLDRNDRVDTTDERARVFLPDAPRTIEWRRDGIELGTLALGTASGRLLAVGNEATVTLPHMLVGSAPATDAVGPARVARHSEARAGQGLPLAQLNPKLSVAADYQATWLATSGVTLLQPGRFPPGPVGSGVGLPPGAGGR